MPHGAHEELFLLEDERNDAGDEVDGAAEQFVVLGALLQARDIEGGIMHDFDSLDSKQNGNVLAKKLLR